MIPQAHIIEWSNHVPWQTNEQVEQDLVICRALVQIFRDDFLHDNLAFRGGTALHKLFLQPQPRYSEDIDLVQITAQPFGKIIDRIRERLDFLGSPQVKLGDKMSTLRFKFESEIAPKQPLKLKVETNSREHFTVLGFEKKEFAVVSSWYTGSCQLNTYKIEELLGTKLRALYQRKKGRDLYDLYKAMTEVKIDSNEVVKCYTDYMSFSVAKPPSAKTFLLSMEEKMADPDFHGDITALIRPGEKYDPNAAYELVKEYLIERI